jgi:hypothetical protein
MKLKTLVILTALAVIFAAAAYYLTQRNKIYNAPSEIGSKIFPNLAVNRVAKLTVFSKDGGTSLVKKQDTWVVANRFNYPAKFEKIADTIRTLNELKIGQTVKINPSELASLNLLPAAQPPAKQPAGTGVLLEMRDENDGLLGSLLIGKGFKSQADKNSPQMMFGFGSYASGQYVKTMDGKACLVADNLERLGEETKTWLSDDFINVPAGDIKEIEISGPEGGPVKLTRPKEGESLTLHDLRPEEGTVDSSKINQAAGALVQLGFDDVADPSISLKETGFDRPTVFKAIARDGIIYTFKLGNTLTNDSFDRYLIVSVTNEASAAQTIETEKKEEDKPKEEAASEAKKNIPETAAALNAKYSPWIYIIKSYRSEPLLLKRSDLIKKPEPPKTDEVKTNAPAVKKDNKKSKPSKKATNQKLEHLQAKFPISSF